MAKVRAHVVISGRVQGVYFRDSARREAQARGVTGWVQNRSDGSVEAILEGEESGVRQVIEWCHRGPSRARVDSVEVEWAPYEREFDSFQVRMEW